MHHIVCSKMGSILCGKLGSILCGRQKDIRLKDGFKLYGISFVSCIGGILCGKLCKLCGKQKDIGLKTGSTITAEGRVCR